MAARDHDFAGYKPVAHTNEVDLALADIKHVVSFRQDSDFSEQFTLDDRDERQNLRKLKSHDQHRERMDSLWIWESAAVFLSLAALAAAVGLLVYLDGTKLQVWQIKISPNAVLAIFMTIAKSCILVAIAAGIAQLKWLYYGSAPRNLGELDLFDNAGRGPWGAACFLFRIGSGKGKAKLVAGVGALLTILALAMDPFAQQLLSYQVQSNPQPALSSQTWVPATSSHATGLSLFKSSGLRQALYGSLLQVDYPVEYQCGSANCTWDPFVSLGVSGHCQDVATTVNQSCLAGAGVLHQNCTQLVYDIPSYNLSIVLQNGSATGTAGQQRHTLTKGVTTALDPFTQKSPVGFQFAVAQLSIEIDETANVTDLKQLQNPSWNVTACSIEWCAKVYNTVRVSNSTFFEAPPEVIDLIPSQNGQCAENTTDACQNFEAADKSQLPEAMANTVFSIAPGYGRASVRDLLNFDYNVTSRYNSSSLNALEAYSVVATLFWGVNITEVVSRVTTAYTNFLRANENTFQVYGTAWTDETYIEVRWVWFSLPAALALLAAAFLIAVIIMSKPRGDESEPLWKASTLPLLLHGVGWSNRREYQMAESSTAIDAVIRGTKAHLRRNHRGDAVFVKVN